MYKVDENLKERIENTIVQYEYKIVHYVTEFKHKNLTLNYDVLKDEQILYIEIVIDESGLIDFVNIRAEMNNVVICNTGTRYVELCDTLEGLLKNAEQTYQRLK